MHDLHMGNLVGGGQQIVHEALAHHLALFVIDELLQQGRPDAMGDAAKGHALDDMGIDDRAAVVADDIAAQLGLADDGIDDHEHQMKLEGMAGIHLHPPVLGQRHAGGHLEDMGGLQPRLRIRWQLVEMAMADGDQLHPGQGLPRAAHHAALIGQRLRRAAEDMGRDLQELALQLARRMVGRAAHHDGHAAAHGRIARQAGDGVRPHHLDPVGIHLQDFADHGGDQGLVSLP